MAGQYFALEIGEDSIKVGDFELKGNSILTNSAGIAPCTHNVYISDTEDSISSTTATIKKLLTDAKISKKNVKIIIPDSQSYSRVIEMPLLSEKELLSTIRYQADQYIPIPIDKANIDVEILLEDTVNKKLIVLLVAGSKSIITKLTDIIEKIGLYPEVLETQMSASLRFCEFAFHNSMQNDKNKDVSKLILFINIGFTSTSLYLFNNKTLIPLQNHQIPLGLDLFMKEIKTNSQIPENKIKELLTTVGFEDTSTYKLSEILNTGYEEFSSELIRYIQSINEKDKITVNQLVLFGDGSKIKGLSNKIGTSLGIQTNVLSVIPFLQSNPVVDYFKDDWPSFVPVIGACL